MRNEVRTFVCSKCVSSQAELTTALEKIRILELEKSKINKKIKNLLNKTAIYEKLYPDDKELKKYREDAKSPGLLNKDDVSGEMFCFGELVENTSASIGNPRKYSFFIKIKIRSGRMNPGKYAVCTDGIGNFWETSFDAIKKAYQLGPGETINE